MVNAATIAELTEDLKAEAARLGYFAMLDAIGNLGALPEQILEAVEVAAQADFPLDRLVIGCDVLVVDGPVLASPFDGAPLEVALAEP